MQKQVIFSAICLSVILAFTNSFAENWNSFESNQGYVLDYPSDWVAAAGNASTLYDNFTGPGATIQVVTFPLDYTDMYGECKTLEDFVDKVVLPNFQPTFRYMADPAVVPKREKTMLNNKDCIILTYSLPNEGNGYPVHKFYLFIDDSLGVRMGYALCAYCNPESQPRAEKIVNSFRSSNNPAIKKAVLEEIKGSQ